MSKQPIIIIPARMDSGRLPGKPLMDIAGTPLLLRTYHRALETGVDRIYVATSDKEICQFCTTHDVPWVMTKADLATGTHRCAEALIDIERVSRFQIDVVINWQCDEPLVRPEDVNRLIEVARYNDRITTMVAPMNEREFDDPNCVKAVGSLVDVNYQGQVFRCHWFSRASMAGAYGHCGMYAFPTQILQLVAELKSTELSRAEGLEQLPWLEDGFEMDAVVVDKMPQSINTKSDIAEMELLYATSSEGSGEHDQGSGG